MPRLGAEPQRGPPQAGDGMETDAAAPPAAPAENGAGAVGLLPEVEAYAFLLVVTLLVDRKQYPEVRARPRRALRARTRAPARPRGARCSQPSSTSQIWSSAEFV